MYHGKLSHHANIFTITGKPEKQSATLLLPTSQIPVQIHINILKPELAYKDVNVGIEKSRKHTNTMLAFFITFHVFVPNNFKVLFGYYFVFTVYYMFFYHPRRNKLNDIKQYADWEIPGTYHSYRNFA